MNAVVSYLTNNWQRLQLEEFGSGRHLSGVMATPRFRASSHVLFFIVAEEDGEVVLVAKVPRLRGDTARLDCEARNLRMVQAARTGGYRSIPRLVAYEDWSGSRLLIETALKGGAMKPAFVRRHSDMCLESMMSWVITLHQDTRQYDQDNQSWFDRLAIQPMQHLESALCSLPDNHHSMSRLRVLVEQLRDVRLPTVFEHGDLSSPNILVAPGSDVGIVDWELAEPEGMPAGDLFFFLTYIAFATARAGTNSVYLKAFDKAFFGRDAWAHPYLARYCQQLDISRGLLRPLFVLYWCRYLSTLLARLNASNANPAILPSDTLAWVRSNRYYALWRHALAHSHNLYF
ncbi:MAG: phosphotransferase family protein [Chromatiales bacterium]